VSIFQHAQFAFKHPVSSSRTLNETSFRLRTAAFAAPIFASKISAFAAQDYSPVASQQDTTIATRKKARRR